MNSGVPDAERVTPSSNGRPMVQLEGVRKSFGDHLVLDGIDLTVAARRGARHHRAERERQEHAAALRQPARADRGGRICWRARRSPARAPTSRRPPADRHRLPAVQPLPAPDGDRQPDARRAPHPEDAAARGGGPCPRAAGDGRARGEGRAASAPALGRSATAGCDRAGADDGPARHALRRGHVGARPGARRRGARRHARPRRARA